MLHNTPHAFDIIFGVSPVAFCVQVTQIQFVLQANFDSTCRACDFSCYKRFATSLGFVVKQNSVTRKQFVSATIVDGLVKRVSFGARIRRLWIERRRFFLWSLQDVTKHFATAGLVNTHWFFSVEQPGCFQNIQCSNANRLESVNRLVIRNANVTLSTQVVDLVWLDIQHKVCECLAIRQIAVVQPELRFIMNVTIDVVDSFG